MCNGNRNYFRKELVFNNNDVRQRFIELYGDLFVKSKSREKIYYLDECDKELIYNKKTMDYECVGAGRPMLICYLTMSDWNKIKSVIDITKYKKNYRNRYQVCI